MVLPFHLCHLQTFLSLGMVLLLVCSSPWKMSRGSWGLPYDPGFTQPDSLNDLSESQCRDAPATCPTLAALLHQEGRFHNTFTSVDDMTLKPEPCGRHCQVRLTIGVEAGSLKSFLQPPSFVVPFQEQKMSWPFLSSCWKLSQEGSCPEGIPPFTQCRPGFALIVLYLSAQSLTPALHFPMFFLSSICMFCSYFCLTCSFQLYNCLRVIANNYTAKQIVGCLENSSTKA